MRDEAQPHLQRRTKFSDHALDFSFHRVADEHIFYVIADNIVKEIVRRNSILPLR